MKCYGLGVFLSVDLFANLMPHSHCFLWAKNYIPVYLFSNIVIAFSYFVIAGVLFYVWIKRRDYSFSFLSYSFGLFILFCGIGHMVMVVNMYSGYYIFESFWHLMTAVVSFSSMIYTIKLVPYLIKVPHIHHMEQIQLALKNMEEALDE